MPIMRPLPGSVLAVFGAGAVGLSAIMAARIAGCTTIVAVDIKDNRLGLARELGATHMINGNREGALGRIMEITGKGADFSLETTGVPACGSQAFNCLTAQGMGCLCRSPTPWQHHATDRYGLYGEIRTHHTRGNRR